MRTKCNKIATQLGINTFHFKVLDFTRTADSDILILKFPNDKTFEDFIEQKKDAQWECSLKILDPTIKLLKVRVY